MSNYVEPLRADIWFARIEMIALGRLADVESSLRHAAHLLQMTPHALRPQVGLSLREDEFEALLKAGELDRAARHLVAMPTALSVCAKSDGETVEARISCVFLGRVITGRGATEATAILNAWTTCLLALRDQFGESLVGVTDQCLRAEGSARRRPS